MATLFMGMRHLQVPIWEVLTLQLQQMLQHDIRQASLFEVADVPGLLVA